MSGIVFFKTRMLTELQRFYIEKIGCELWLDQGDCKLFRHGNFIFGLCERDEPETEGMLTFFYSTRDQVDRMYERFKQTALSPPSYNEKYRIYQFFAADPEGRPLEFQYFDHPIEPHRMSDELLLSRRSFRQFKPDSIDEGVLNNAIELARFAPTSKNCQSYYFKIISDPETKKRLSETRGKPSGPINAAPLAVAVASDPALSKRHIQDACIGAYHFMLAAWCYGLGTCWIAAMDREDVKEWLVIPKEHYIATVTPLGYPEEPDKSPPARKTTEEFLRR